jgi:nitrilase
VGTVRRDQERILYAGIDPDELIKGKYEMDAAGHYNRPDVFKFEVLK